MKTFKQPEVEVVRFAQTDVLTSSVCSEDQKCKPCPGCPPGANSCTYYDTCPTYSCSTDDL